MILKATPQRERGNEDSFTWLADGDIEAAVAWKEGWGRKDPKVVL